MKRYCMVETASDNLDELNNIAQLLLDNKLVASCHIIKSESSWNWKNQRELAKEHLLQVKTTQDKLKDIFNLLKKHHSYNVFEFAIYEFKSTNAEYLKWIDDEICDEICNEIDDETDE